MNALKVCECDEPGCSWCESVQTSGTVEIPKDRLLMLWGALLAAGVKEWIAGEPMPEMSPQRMTLLLGVMHSWLYEAFAAVTSDVPAPPDELL